MSNNLSCCKAGNGPVGKALNLGVRGSPPSPQDAEGWGRSAYAQQIRTRHSYGPDKSTITSAVRTSVEYACTRTHTYMSAMHTHRPTRAATWAPCGRGYDELREEPSPPSCCLFSSGCPWRLVIMTGAGEYYFAHNVMTGLK